MSPEPMENAPSARKAIADELFHSQRRLHPGHVLGRKRCEAIVDFVLDAIAPTGGRPPDPGRPAPGGPSPVPLPWRKRDH